MHTIAIFNAKGGVGKTTTAHSLACGLVDRRRRVLALDLDPQAHLSHWFAADTSMPTLYDAIAGNATLPACVQATASGVDLVACNELLSGAEPLLRAKIGGDRWIARQLERIPDRWDYCVLDCAPGLGILTVGALAAATHVIAPAEPAVLGLMGTQRLLETIEEARESINPGLALLGVLPVKVDRRTGMGAELLQQLRDTLGPELLPIVGVNVRLAEAPAHQVPIFKHAPSSRGTQDYRALVTEVIRRVEA